MEDDVRPEALHHLEHPLGLLAVREHRLHPGEVALLDHLAVDPEEVVLGVIEDNEQLRPHPGDLADELRADRAAGAGHEHDLVLHVGADPVELHLHRFASEDVLHLDLAQLPGELHSAAEELEDGRQRPHGNVSLTAGRDDPAAHHARSGGDRDDHLVGMELVEDLPDLLGRAEDVEAMQAHAALARVVVEEADRLRPEVGVELQLAGDHLPSRPRADHEHPPRAADIAAGEPLHQDHPSEEPGAADQEDREQEVADDDRPRDLVVERLQQQERDRQDRGRDRAGAQHGDHVRQAEVAPPLLVEAGDVEDDQLPGHHEADRGGEHVVVALRDPARGIEEAQPEGQVVSQRDEDCVGGDLDHSVTPDGVLEPIHAGSRV